MAVKTWLKKTEEIRIKKNLKKNFLTIKPRNNNNPKYEKNKLNTYEKKPNKNINKLEPKAPKYPKKLLISPKDLSLPSPGSLGLCVQRLMVKNSPKQNNIKPVKILNRKNLNPPYLNIIIISNTSRIR